MVFHCEILRGSERSYSTFYSNSKPLPRKTMPKRKEIDKIKKLIMDKYAPKGGFDLSEVYDDPSDPADLYIYEAVNELIDEKKIKGKKVSLTGNTGTHGEMKYKKAHQEMKASLVKLAYENPEMRAKLLPILENFPLKKAKESSEKMMSSLVDSTLNMMSRDLKIDLKVEKSSKTYTLRDHYPQTSDLRLEIELQWIPQFEVKVTCKLWDKTSKKNPKPKVLEQTKVILDALNYGSTGALSDMEKAVKRVCKSFIRDNTNL